MARKHESLYFYPVLAPLFIAAVWNQVPVRIILLWLGLILILAASIILFIRLYQSSPHSYQAIKIWIIILIIQAFFSGIVWGYASWFFILADDPIRFVVIVYTITAIAGASINPYFLLPPTYLAFILPCITPFIIKVFEIGSWTSLLLAVPILIVFLITAKLSTIGYELRQQKLIAEKANQEKSRFIAAASHDLRQPLHSLGLFINALENKSKNAQNESLFDKINQSLNNLGQLFNSILDISKLDADAIEFRKTHFELSEIFTALRTEYQQTAELRSIDFKLSGGDQIVYTDRILLQRIIKNLVDNAFAYTKHGTISIMAKLVDDEVTVEVIDSGVGIPEAEQKNIFSEFYQLNNPERDRDKGLGLGLSIVKRLCTLLDINYSLVSKADEGTTFTLTLPAGSKTKISTNISKESPPSWTLNHIKVMVIDDEKAIRESMKEVLHSWQLEVKVVEGLSSATKLLSTSEFTPDIIISDFRLRGNENGVDVVNTLKHQFKISPECLLISGDTSVESLDRIKESGFLYLHKPVSPMLLRRALFELRNGGTG